MLSGSKTYLAAFGLALTALGGYLHGDLTASEALVVFLNGGGLASVRAALSAAHKATLTAVAVTSDKGGEASLAGPQSPAVGPVPSKASPPPGAS